MANAPPAAPQLVRGNRGLDSRVLVYDGYKYQLNKNRQTGMYWRCCREDCRASVKTNSVNLQNLNAVIRAINYVDNHNHAKDDVRIERTDIVSQMKDAIIARPTIAVKEVYDDVVARLHQNAGAAGRLPPDIPDFDSVRSSLQRTKQQQCPPIPNNINQVNFPGTYGQTHLRERYLLHLNNVSGVALFSTDIELQFMANAHTIYVDGTFRSAPGPYTQVFTVHAEYMGRVIVLAVALLNGKRQPQYDEIFTVLIREMTRVNANINIRQVVSDFELAVFNAVRVAFPNAQISGCYFHFTQNLWRHTQELGLAAAFNQDAALKRCLTHVYALGFVPINHVLLCYNTILNDPVTQQLIARYPNVRQFFMYVHNTYLVGQNFPPDTWNVYNRGMSTRTNNFVESYHGRWNKKIGVRHPSLWVFVAKMQDQQALSRNSLNNAVNGNPPVTRRRKWQLLEQRIINLKLSLQNGQRTVMQYWSAVRHNIEQFK